VFVESLSCCSDVTNCWLEVSGTFCENNAFPTDGAKLLVSKSRVDFYNLTSQRFVFV